VIKRIKVCICLIRLDFREFVLIKVAHFFRELKRSSAPPGHLKEKMEAALQQSKPEIPRDADSDFAEINTLDDVDVSDQLVKKKEVCLLCITWVRVMVFNATLNNISVLSWSSVLLMEET
jgi:hypothetical protein